MLEVEGVNKAFGDDMLIDDLSFRVPAGAIVGIVGPNGAGKSTLFKMITGQETADSGTIRVGETVSLGYVDQSRDHLERQELGVAGSLRRAGHDRRGQVPMPSRAYVGAFNFKGGDQQKAVGKLSGGERNRVHLAKMLKTGAQLHHAR